MRWAAVAVIVVAAVFNYRAMLEYTTRMFGEPLEDMQHGWVVPFVSLWVLWSQRRALREAAGAGRPSWAGAAWVVLFLAVAWLGGRGGQTRIEQVSFIGLVWALPFAFWGRGVERLMRFPAAFLAFTIPVSSFIDFFTIHLRMASVMMATGILNGFGMAIERSGTALFSHTPGGTFNVDVADPCSGIRSLFAMMALTAAYAYFTQKGFWKKWALFACSLPIAVVGNMVRILSICVVASWFGQDAAMGYYHDYSGFVIFVVGVYLMFFVGERIKKSTFGFWEWKIWEQRPETGGRRSGVWLVAGVSALALAVFMAGYVMPAPVYETASFVAETLPERVGEFEGDVPWFCQDPQCLEVVEQRMLKTGTVEGTEGYVCPGCGKLMESKSLGEVTVLPKDTVILKRNYRSADGLVYAVSMVVQGRSRYSIHRAELCLPSQGFVMEKARRTPLKLTGRVRPLMVRQIDAHRPAGGARMPVKMDGRSVWLTQPDADGHPGGDAVGMSLVYWFESREQECCSHTQRILTDVWDRSIHNRINRWIMVSVNVSSGLGSPEGVERFEAFLSELYPKIMLER
jgi:exosortase